MGLLDFIRRRRLTQKGLSSGKKRRTQSDARMVGALDHSATVRYGIYAGFAVVLALLASSFAKSGAGAFMEEHAAVSSVLVVAMAVLMFELFHRGVATRNGHVLLVFGGLAAQLAILQSVGVIVTNSELGPSFNLLLIPFALAPMIHAVLLGINVGLYSVVCTSLFGAFVVPSQSLLPYLCMSMVCGLVAVLVTRQVRKRGRLLRAGFYVGGAVAVLACSFNVIQLGLLREGGVASWQGFGIEVGAGFGVGLLTGMIVSGLLPILESAFTLTTGISWLELSDLNHRLLRRMQLEAPGTFHHSMVVASLAEAAAESIGANPMVCRVCSYFHDIGKLNKPEYFIENQGEVNPHDSLTPTMSALVIIAHVKDGVDMAIKHKLNPRIIDVIREHHGDSLVYFFYRKAQEQRRQQEEKVEDGLENPEDLPDIDEKNFRYPGPCPRTRESGLISLADAIESASRSMRKPTPRKIRTLVDDIVFNRIRDGQLDNCGLTVRDLKKARESFSKTLSSMMHSRIEYPRKVSERDAEKEPERGPGREGQEEGAGGDRRREAPTQGGRKSPGPPKAGNVVTVEELQKRRQKAAGES